MFFLVAWLVYSGWGLNIDRTLSGWIYDAMGVGRWRVIFVLLSLLGFGSFLGFLLVAIFLLLVRRNIAAFFYLISGGLVGTLVWGLKNWFIRIRPFEEIGDVVALSMGNIDKYSFPSAHSALAFFTAIFLANRFSLNFSGRLVMLFLAFMIALSRVYIGVHYVLDVIAGAILGILIGQVAECLWRKVITRN